MADAFTTQHGVRAYDAARWLEPPPEVRRIRRLPSGATCLVQMGASRRRGVVQEALVSGRVDESLLVFPDGTRAFDLHLGPARTQPNALIGIARMGPDVAARWVARPTRTRMIQLHFPLGLRRKLAVGEPAGFEGAYTGTDPVLASLLGAFAADCGADAPDLVLDGYVALIASKLTAAVGGGATRRPAPDRRVQRTGEWLRSDIARDFSLQELADEAGLSPSQYLRVFRRSTGETPHRYLTRLRIERACELLHESRLSVLDVAAQVGFEDPSYFARVFRKAVNTSPAAYRRERRGE